MSYSADKDKPAKVTLNLGDITIKNHKKKPTVIVIQVNDKNKFYFKYSNISEKLEWLNAMEEGQYIAHKEDTVVLGNSIDLKQEFEKKEQLLKTAPKPLKSKSSSNGKQKDEILLKLDVAASENAFKRPKAVTLTPSDSPDFLTQNAVIHKNQILEDLSKIFYETQMLSNDSPVTKELLSVQRSASKIYESLRNSLVEMVDK